MIKNEIYIFHSYKWPDYPNLNNFTFPSWFITKDVIPQLSILNLNHASGGNYNILHTKNLIKKIKT